MTPLHLQMLLHYHVCVDDDDYAKYQPDHARSRAVTDYRADLLEWGLIEFSTEPTKPNYSGINTTSKGKCFVDALCSLPMPVKIERWEMPK